MERRRLQPPERLDGGVGEATLPPREREEEEALLAAPSRGETRELTMTNENRIQLAGSAQRERARDDEEEQQSSRCRLLRKAKEASIRELQLDDEEER